MIARPTRPRWSVTMLTLPEREPYLLRLLQSLSDAGADTNTEVVVVYNAPPRESRDAITRRLAAACPSLSLRVRFNDGRQTIAEGRNLQLAVCRAPLICFVDDDVTLHGQVFAPVERALREQPVALVGLPSLREDSAEPFKPRADTPYVDAGGLRYMHVQGMLCAGYRQVLIDVGGFSRLRAFWGEWTELNTRLWRRGFPTAYRMDAGYLRHWSGAPHSPTRHRADRALHILWGLACTAIEYDAVAASPASRPFWTVIEERYLRYAFAAGATPPEVFRTMLELAPRLVEAWPAIRTARARAASDPFPFSPFHPLSPAEVGGLRRHAARALAPMKRMAFSGTRLTDPDFAASSRPLFPAWRLSVGFPRVDRAAR
ncbi:MAG: glycosyltransferase family 2 protein [Gemmatimonadales bacterium]